MSIKVDYIKTFASSRHPLIELPMAAHLSCLVAVFMFHRYPKTLTFCMSLSSLNLQFLKSLVANVHHILKHDKNVFRMWMRDHYCVLVCVCG